MKFKRKVGDRVARPKLYTSVDKMEEIIEEYFNMCDEKEKPYTMS